VQDEGVLVLGVPVVAAEPVQASLHVAYLQDLPQTTGTGAEFAAGRGGTDGIAAEGEEDQLERGGRVRLLQPAEELSLRLLLRTPLLPPRRGSLILIA
jgi:hypothetical protein